MTAEDAARIGSCVVKILEEYDLETDGISVIITLSPSLTAYVGPQRARLVHQTDKNGYDVLKTWRTAGA
jgi:hypothetical protein